MLAFLLITLFDFPFDRWHLDISYCFVLKWIRCDSLGQSATQNGFQFRVVSQPAAVLFSAGARSVLRRFTDYIYIGFVGFFFVVVVYKKIMRYDESESSSLRCKKLNYTTACFIFNGFFKPTQ